MLIRQPPRGFSLISLLVALAIGSVVLSAAGAVFASNMSSATNAVRLTRLNQELRILTGLVAADVRRAGYRGGDPALVDMRTNNFNQTVNDITVGNKSGEPNNSCVYFSYDIDRDAVVDADEVVGYRLRAGKAELLVTVASPVSCNSGSWEAITSNSLVLSQLNFSLVESCVNASTITSPPTVCNSSDDKLLIRSLVMNVAGRSEGNAELIQSLSRQIRLRNDKVVEAP